MKIYTGYFSNIREYNGKKLIRVCLYSPKGIEEMDNYKPLNPTKEILKLKYKEEEYKKEYKKLLEQVSYEDFINFLKERSEGKDIVLLCYESPEQFCHRQMISEWINSYGEYKVEEYDDQYQLF